MVNGPFSFNSPEARPKLTSRSIRLDEQPTAKLQADQAHLVNVLASADTGRKEQSEHQQRRLHGEKNDKKEGCQENHLICGRGSIVHNRILIIGHYQFKGAHI